MVIKLYLCTFLAAFALLISLLVFHRRITTGSVLFCLLVIVNSFGRYLVSVSTTYEMARLGNLMIYVGACFCPFMVVRMLVRLSDVKMPRWLTAVLFCWSCLVMALVVTVGHSPIYYKSMELVQTESFAYLDKVYGPTHILYPALILVYFSLVAWLLFYAVRKYKEVSLRTITPIVLLALVIMVSYVFERVLDTRVSYLSVGYLVGMLLLIRYIDYVNMYDMPTNIANCIESKDENGYIQFDSKFRCAGYNNRIKELFPEVEEKWNVDDPIPVDDSFLYTEIIQWIYRRKKTEKKTVFVKNRYYEMFVHEIPYGYRKCVGYMLEMVDRTTEKKYLNAVEHYNENLEAAVKSQTAHIEHIKDMMVVGMAAMVESRDNSTGGHIKRTSKVMQVFAQHLIGYLTMVGTTPAFLEMVVRAAPMHDLGKIAVDDAILRKQGKCTQEEFAMMKKHPEEGARIVRQLLDGVEDPEFVTLAENVAHYHHEKWDGSGYPCGLKGKAIPLEARLMALADVFDALVSRRCYKPPMPYNQAFSIIEEGIGTHFDPLLGPLFMQCRPQLEELYDEWNTREG